MEELVKIQTELKCDKDLRNEFGNYAYRSLETIMNAVKPLLKKYNCSLTCTDEVMLIGDRYYVKATATVVNSKGVSVSASSYAREQVQKKGMDEAQITGSASSYARKYAACGLLGISDGYDPDAMDNREEGQGATPNNATNKPQKRATTATADKSLKSALNAVNNAKNRADLDAAFKQFGNAFQGADADAFYKALNDKAAKV